MHFVYIIQSEKDYRYYIGSTHDPQLRLMRHNEGWTRSTQGRGSWKLVYIEEYDTKRDALQRESEFNGIGPASKTTRLSEPEWAKLSRLSFSESHLLLAGVNISLDEGFFIVHRLWNCVLPVALMAPIVPVS